MPFHSFLTKKNGLENVNLDICVVKSLQPFDITLSCLQDDNYYRRIKLFMKLPFLLYKGGVK